MTPPALHAVLRQLSSDDPLALGRVEWRPRCLEARRFSSIWSLEPSCGGGPLRERTGGEDLVLKLYRVAQPERRQREYDDLVRVHVAMGPAGGVVRPVACYAERGAVITARAPGTPFGRLVREACRRGADRETLARAAALCTAAGGWLRNFQTYGVEAMRGNRPQFLGSADTFLSYVDERLRILRALRPGIEPSLHARLLAHSAAVLHSLPPRVLETVTWSHSDFGPHNLLADGERVWVLDFELAPQHPCFDVTYFVESLAHGGGPLVEAARVRRLARAFLAGYGAEIDVPLMALFRLRHLACAYVSEARRGGMAGLRGYPGLLGMRTRLRELPDLLTIRPGTRVA